MSHAEWFYLVPTAQEHWIVRHQLTDRLAGNLMLTTRGFRLRDEQGRELGTFESLEKAMEGLYEMA